MALTVIGFWMNISENSQEKSFEQNDIALQENQPQNGEQVNVFSTKDLNLGELFGLIGSSKKEVQKKIGKPARIDVSGYGYDWWIYNKNKEEYVQIGMDQGKVVTVYAIGENVDIEPFFIGQSIGEIYAMNIVDTNINFEYKDSLYRLELSEEDITTNPLIKVNHIFVQLYIDTFTGQLSSIRLMDAQTLINIRPYELLFRGELLEPSVEFEIDEKQLKADREKQVSELTNVIRRRYEAEVLEIDEDVAKVAYAHSIDMYESGDFPHPSQKYGEITDRLKASEITFQNSGENIASHSIDAADVVEEWLSSKEYRDNLLKEDFTHFGVGVYKDYYTQVFIQKP